jgi:hypothetical protein
MISTQEGLIKKNQWTQHEWFYHLPMPLDVLDRNEPLDGELARMSPNLNSVRLIAPAATNHCFTNFLLIDGCSLGRISIAM